MGNVPKLRFPEFEEEWVEKYLGDICDIQGGGTPPTNSNEYWNGEVDWYTPSEIGKAKYVYGSLRKISKIGLKKSSAKLLPIGTILLTTRASLGDMSITMTPCTTNQGFQSLIAKKGFFNEFIYYCQPLIKKHCNIAASGSTFLEISKYNLSKLSLKIPTLPEQTKTANFLTLFDKKIEKQAEKVAALEEYKKGLMHKIFSREIRFKDDEGKNYPEWEEVKLGDVGTTYSGLSGKSKYDFSLGNKIYITYMNVFNNTIAAVEAVDRVKINPTENQNKVSHGDILFTTSSETRDEVGMSSVWLHDSEVYLNSFCFGYKLKVQNMFDSFFLAYLLRSPEMRKRVTTLSQGSTRYNLSKNALMKLYIYLPAVAEQTKIANSLTLFDRKIAKEKEKLVALQEQKKGLLQQMFV